MVPASKGRRNRASRGEPFLHPAGVSFVTWLPCIQPLPLALDLKNLFLLSIACCRDTTPDQPVQLVNSQGQPVEAAASASGAAAGASDAAAAPAAAGTETRGDEPPPPEPFEYNPQ